MNTFSDHHITLYAACTLYAINIYSIHSYACLLHACVAIHIAHIYVALVFYLNVRIKCIYTYACSYSLLYILLGFYPTKLIIIVTIRVGIEPDSHFECVSVNNKCNHR